MWLFRWSKRRIILFVALLGIGICLFNILLSALRFVGNITHVDVSIGRTVGANITIRRGKVIHWKPEGSNRSLVTTLFEDEDVGRRMVNQLQFSHRSGRVKKILLIPHANYPQPPDGDKIFHDTHCPITDCEITRNYKDSPMADALLFQKFSWSIRSSFLPKPSSQVWIACAGESPAITNMRWFFLNTEAMGSLVNWTVYYRRDATIPIPSGVFLPFRNSSVNPPPIHTVNYAQGRTKKVAWFVSNCGFFGFVTSGRTDYATELSKYIDVDIYGKCGTLSCPKSDADCDAMLRRDYKFYLAFENSNCRDYISEKFFSNALKNDLVPIVYGAARADYEVFAPPGSFIHADDFSSPQDLAKYLLELDSNDALYNEYFRWKSTGEFLESASSYWCRVCTMLHANDHARDRRWYDDFHGWWDSGVCLEQVPGKKWYSWKTDKLHYLGSRSSKLSSQFAMISHIFLFSKILFL